MSDQAWEQLVDLVDQKYSIDDHSRRREPLDDAPDFHCLVETISFTKDGQDYRIERTVQPAVLDTKTHYARAGVAQRVQKTYDPENTVARVSFSRRINGTWQEVAPEGLLT